MIMHMTKKAQGFKIIIVGCGKIGTTLVERLCKEGHDITVIDTKTQVVNDVTGTYDVMGITGNGASLSVQLEAGIDQTDLIIAVTGSDELNLLCCTIAKKVGKRCLAVARVRNPDYAEELSYLRTQLGLSVISNPELATAKEMARLLRLPTALEINSFAKGHAEIVKFKVPERNAICNKSVMEIADYQSDLLFVGVEHNGELTIPDGNTRICEGDVVSFIARPVVTHKFFKKIGIDTHAIKDCIIVGGGKTSFYLAKELTSMGIKVKIIELDEKRCEELSLLLPKALIINGDGSDEALLREEGIEEAGAFIPLTGIDEENVILTLFAKKCAGTKVITKINRTTFNDVIDSLDLDSVIYPRYLTTESILSFVRGMQNTIGSKIETMYHIFDNRAEALEFNVESNSEITGKKLKELSLKNELLLSCINRNGKIIIPKGDDIIQAGDHIIVVTRHTGFTEAGDILR